MTSKGKHAVLIVAVCLAVGGRFGGTALAAETTTVAVLNFAQRTAGPEAEEYRWLEKGLADLVIADLSTRRGLSVVTREQMQMLTELHKIDNVLAPPEEAEEAQEAQEAGAPQDVPIDAPEPGFTKRVGTWMKARRVVFGTYAVTGESVSLEAQVMDAGRGEVSGRAEVSGRYRDVLKLEKTLAGKVIAILEGAGEPAQLAGGLPIWTDSIPATTHLYTGLDLFDQGGYADAWVEFRGALRQDAEYADAAYWSARMYYYMTRYMHARPELQSFLSRFPDHGRAGDAAIEYAHTWEITSESPTDLEAVYRDLLETAPPQAKVYHFIAADNPAGIGLREWLMFRLAQTLIGQSRYKEAFETYETLLAEAGKRNTWPRYFARQLARLLGNRARAETGEILSSTYQDRVVLQITLASGDEKYRYVPPAPLMIEREKRGIRHIMHCADGYAFDTVKFRIDFHHDLNFPDAACRLQVQKYFYVDLDSVWSPLRNFASGSEKVAASFAEKEVTMPVGCNSFQFVPQFVAGGRRDLECLASLDAVSLDAKIVTTGPVGRIDVQLDNLEDAKTFLDGRYLRTYAGMVSNIPAREYQLTARHVTDGVFKWAGTSGAMFAEHRTALRVRAGEVTPVRIRLELTEAAKSCGFQTPVGIATGYPAFKVRPRRLYNGHDVGLRPTAVYDRPGRRWVCVWSRLDDLWIATSRNGRDWDGPVCVGTPLNSAHREFMPRLIQDAEGRFCLTFISDRNHRRDYALYVSYSRDLRLWTGPRMVSSDPVMTTGFMCDNGGRRIITTSPLTWPRAGVVMFESTGPDEWRERPLAVPGLGETYLLSMRLVQDRRGRYHLVFAIPWAAAMASPTIAGESGEKLGVLGYSSSDDLEVWTEPNLLKLDDRFWVEAADAICIGDYLFATVSKKDRAYTQRETTRFYLRRIDDPSAEWKEMGEAMFGGISHSLALAGDDLLWVWSTVDYVNTQHKHGGKTRAMLIDTRKLIANLPADGGT